MQLELLCLSTKVDSLGWVLRQHRKFVHFLYSTIFGSLYKINILNNLRTP